MVKDVRYTLRKKSPYNTRRSVRRLVKTPGGRLSLQYQKKLANVPKCGDCGLKLRGIPAFRPMEMHSLSKNKKIVHRAYGGSRCHKCVKDRIIRSFLLEERANVKSVMKKQASSAPAAPAKTAKAAAKKTTKTDAKAPAKGAKAATKAAPAKGAKAAPAKKTGKN